MKISFDTNSDSYDDALSALNAAYGVESVSASSLGATARSVMGTVPMTRDEFEALYASIPADKLRTADDDIILFRTCPTPAKRKEDAIWSLEHCVSEVHPAFQLMLDEQTFTAEDWEKLYNVLDVLVKWEE